MRFLKFLIFGFVLTFSNYSLADHLAGGYFEYQKVSSTVYHIDFYFLRDCQGAEADHAELFLRNDCGYECTYLGEMTRYESTAIDYGCGAICNNNQGFESIHFGMDVTLPTICDSWIVSTAIGVRNEVEFVENEGSYFNYCRINNTVDNNSPNVSGANIIVGCSSWGANSLYNVSQTDGDQIIYDLVPALNATILNTSSDWCYSYPAQYGQGLSPSLPFPASGPLAIQPDGSFTFTPTDIGTSYFAVRAREYRNNILIGEIVIEGMMLIEDCPSTNEVTFNSFSNSGNNIMTVSGIPGTYCETVIIESDEPIENVWVEAPPYVTYSVQGISPEEVAVTLCVQFPTDNLCSQIDIGAVIYAQSGDLGNCLAESNNVADRGYYVIRKLAGEYCPDNLFFTNRNLTSGIPMPLYAHAEERIWVGDDMPAIAPLAVQNDEGIVNVIGDLVLVAGVEIIIPSCQSGNGCVTLDGDITLIIHPNSCSSDCIPEELSLSVTELFNCYHEQLQAVVEGNGPFTFKWTIDGQIITTSESYLFIHDIVSIHNTGQIPYTCEVFDAVGNSGTFSGEILGTQVFYEPMSNNVSYYDYDEEDIWDDGYYYAGQPGVGGLPNNPSRPFFIYDDINTNGPWYGATFMELLVFDRWGESLAHFYVRDLEGGEDWSFNNGEIWWNGYWWNDPNSSCLNTSGTDVFNYRITARNCLPVPHIEESVIPIIYCHDGDWDVIETKSVVNIDDEVIVIHDSTRYIGFDSPHYVEENFVCFPNPSNSKISLVGSGVNTFDVAIIDEMGKVVIKRTNHSNNNEIDISMISAGVYTIKINTENGEKRIKLVKN